MKEKIRAIMRGHLISIDCEMTLLENFRNEFYKTKYYGVIISKSFVSFRKGKDIFRFYFKDIKKFYLKDSCIFVIDIIKTKKRFYFKIIN